MSRSPSAAPVAKVTAAGTGGTITTLLIWAAKTYGGVEITPEVAAALATAIAFVAGYLTPPR